MPRIDERTRPWWTLIGACSGLFLLMLDSTVVALALSSIRVDLGANAAELQWVMNGYLRSGPHRLWLDRAAGARTDH